MLIFLRLSSQIGSLSPNVYFICLCMYYLIGPVDVWRVEWLNGQESTCQCRRYRFNLWVGRIPWRRKWQPTLVFLPGKSPGQGSLMATVHGVTKSWTWFSNWTITNNNCLQSIVPRDLSLREAIRKNWGKADILP